MITNVCAKRLLVRDAGDGTGEKLKFKVVDGEMVFPVDSKGYPYGAPVGYAPSP